MKKIIDFKEYLLTKILESMELRVKEVELVLSPKLIKILKTINHKISDDLLEKHINSDKAEFKVTFVDLGTEPGEVSFIQANKIPDLVEPDLVHGDYHKEFKPRTDGKQHVPGKERKSDWDTGYFDFVHTYKNEFISDINHLISLHDQQFKSKDHPVWNKFRASTTIGRFVNTIFPKKYVANMTRAKMDELDKPVDVESFGNMFKAAVESTSKIIRIVEGEDIRHYYSSDNYFKDSGTLAGSCMNGPHKGKFLDIYVKNPEKVKMAILYPEDIRDKIIGRALLWTLDEPEGRIYMDRIYTAMDSDQFMFIEYAKAHGYLYKSSQTYGWAYDIIDGKNDKRATLSMKVQLKSKSHKYYPYTDTMQFYNPTTGLITNDGKFVKRGEGYTIITNTDGGNSPY